LKGGLKEEEQIQAVGEIQRTDGLSSKQNGSSLHGEEITQGSDAETTLQGGTINEN
jgi:hypothetical protein